MLTPNQSISLITHKHISHSLRTILPTIRSQSVGKLSAFNPSPRKFLRIQHTIMPSESSARRDSSLFLIKNLNLLNKNQIFQGSSPDLKKQNQKKRRKTSQKRIQSMDDLLKKFREYKKTGNIKQVKKGVNRLYEGYGKLRKEVTRMQNLDEDYNEFVKVWKDRANEHCMSEAKINVLKGRLRVIRNRKEKVGSGRPEKSLKGSN